MRRSLAALFIACMAAVPGSQERDAAAVLADMRQALGGAAVLDAIRTVALEGTSTRTIQGRGRPNDLEILAILPDHYLEIRRDHGSPGPIDTRVTYYDGFRPNGRIRRTDATIQFPPPPGPNTPEARAEMDRIGSLHGRQAFARLALVLFGRAFDVYPLDFTYVGLAQEGGRTYEVVDARAADGYVMRLAIDQQTRLPAVLSWTAAEEMVITTSSRVMTRGGEVVSRQDDPPPVTPSGPPPMTVRKLTVSDFKVQDGVNWPRRLLETSPILTHEIRLRRVKLNPSLEPRRFDIR